MQTPETQAPPTATAGKVRARDLSTSWEAAKAQKAGRVAAIQVAIYELLRTSRARGEDGKTHEEILLRVGALAFPDGRGGYAMAASSSLRTRTAELVQAGWVVNAGKRRNKSGRLMTVWRAVLDSDSLVDLLPEPAEHVATLSKHEKGMKSVALMADWEGVDSLVADRIIAAYLHPELTERTIAAEMSR